MNPVKKILGYDVSKDRRQRCGCGHRWSDHEWNDCKGRICLVEGCNCEDGEWTE
jgi:hypothetical protein